MFKLPTLASLDLRDNCALGDAALGALAAALLPADGAAGAGGCGSDGEGGAGWGVRAAPSALRELLVGCTGGSGGGGRCCLCGRGAGGSAAVTGQALSAATEDALAACVAASVADASRAWIR